MRRSEGWGIGEPSEREADMIDRAYDEACDIAAERRAEMIDEPKR